MFDGVLTPSTKPEDVGRPLTPKELAEAIHRNEARDHQLGLNQHEPHSKRAMLLRARLDAFKEWLASNGAEIEEPASQWELMRYRAPGSGRNGGKKGKETVHIIFRKKCGRVTFTADTSLHFSLFVADLPFPVFENATTRRKRIRAEQKKRVTWTAKTRAILYERDGHQCWFCHLPLNGDVTIEHMLAQKLGGTDHIDNLVLAHSQCNQKAGHKTPEEKQAIREYHRGGLHSKVQHWIDPPARRTRKKST